MSRAQKYYPRKRYIYALFFAHGAVYIGQSVNPARRVTQHYGKHGGWCGAQFRMRVLHDFIGTQTDGEHLEQAYRLRALRRGLRVYGLPHVYVDPRKRANLYQWVASFRLPWPKDEGRPLGAFMRWMELASIPTALVVLVGAYIVLN